MRRLNSFSGFLSKRVYPFVFYAFMGVAVVAGALNGELLSHPGSTLGLLLVIAGYYLFQKLLISDTIDEVVDLGDHLLIRRGKTKDRIALRDIVKVDASTNLSPPLVTLHLARPSKLGSLITFIPAAGLNPFGGQSLAKELTSRAEAERGVSAE